MDPRLASIVALLALALDGCEGASRHVRGPVAAGPVLVMPQVDLRGAESYLSGVIERPMGFRECLLSWNVSGADTGAWIELRVAPGDGGWSPWLHVGEWRAARPPGALREVPGARIDVDYLRAERAFVRVQARVRRAPAGDGVLTVDLLAFAFDPVARDRTAADVPDPRVLGRVLDVPPLSQREQDPALAARVCSPTSVTMVLAHHGRRLDVADSAAAIYDAAHDLYGNWPRAMQFAHDQGLRAYLGRFDRWAPVEEQILRGQPVVLSVAFGSGELEGAPLDSTRGHLLVVCGFDERGDVVVNDPAAASAAGVRRTYDRAQLGRAWWGHGGTAYVLERRP